MYLTGGFFLFIKMIEIIPKSDLPKDHKLSRHLLDNADHVAVIRFYGGKYYIPIGFKERRLMGLQIRDGQPVFKVQRSVFDWEDFFRTIIDVVYLQVRDTVGSEIKQHLEQEIHESFDRLFSDQLEKKIEKLLPKPNDKLT